MNYYERHLGDYAKDTKHLSMLEHGAYNLLLDRYYATEEGIPANQVYRVSGAKSKAERTAVDAVLAEFFSLSDGVWIKNRVEEEIDRYLVSIPEEETKRNNDKERKRRSRERRKELYATLRGHGVVMPWDATIAQLQTELSRVTGVTGHTATPVTSVTPVTCDETAIHNPVPSNPEDSERDKSLSAPPVTGTESPPDPRKAMFDLGIKLLGGSEKSSRGLVGKAVSEVGEKRVAEILASMAVKPPIEPRAFFAKAIQSTTKPNGTAQAVVYP